MAKAEDEADAKDESAEPPREESSEEGGVA
jgi:hypothetical protein